MAQMGPLGRGGARRRTRRRMGGGVTGSSKSSQPDASQSQQSTDPMAMLKQLGELHEAGVLTDAEFESKKAKILEKL